MAPSRMNWLFHATSAMSVLFALTITAMVATLSAPENHPLNVALNKYGGAALALEMLGIVVCGGLAIWIDASTTPQPQSKSASNALSGNPPLPAETTREPGEDKPVA